MYVDITVILLNLVHVLVKRKYKSRPRYPHTMFTWWFVIIGEENLLQQLQQEWSTINNQTEGKWSLEPLLCYDLESTPIGTSCPESSISPTNVHVYQSPNPHQESESTTMDSNAVTSGNSSSNSSQ